MNDDNSAPLQSRPQNYETYWATRQDLLYYQVCRILVSGLASDAKSMIDVGSAGCPYLEWFPHIEDRVSLDLYKPYAAEGIRSYTGDFLQWKPDRKYDVATCFQVMEHVPNAKAFAKKLLSVSDIVVVSAPYKWAKGRALTHVHDPVDEYKLYSWFGRHPNYSYVVKEIKTNLERIVQVYDTLDVPWASIGNRDAIIESRAKKREKQQEL